MPTLAERITEALDEWLADWRDSTFSTEEVAYMAEHGFVVRSPLAGAHEDGQFCHLLFIHANGEREEHFFEGHEALADAASFVAVAEEAAARRREADRLGVHPLEIEFAPFGPAWEREQREEGRL